MATAGERSGKRKEEPTEKKNFNVFLLEIFEKAREIYDKGRGSRIRFTDDDLRNLERVALESRLKEKQQLVIEKIPYEQMRKWVLNNLKNIGDRTFVPENRAVMLAMDLCNIFENSQTPEELGINLKRWVVG